jgi:hypothetical protein
VIWLEILILIGLVVRIIYDAVHDARNDQGKAIFDLECRLEQRIVKLERDLDRGD